MWRWLGTNPYGSWQDYFYLDTHRLEAFIDKLGGIISKQIDGIPELALYIPVNISAALHATAIFTGTVLVILRTWSAINMANWSPN